MSYFIGCPLLYFTGQAYGAHVFVVTLGSTENRISVNHLVSVYDVGSVGEWESAGLTHWRSRVQTPVSAGAAHETIGLCPVYCIHINPVNRQTHLYKVLFLTIDTF